MCKKFHKYQYQDKFFLNDCSIHMYTHQTPYQHTFHGTPKSKMQQKSKKKKHQILKLQNENDTKTKNLSMKIISIQY